MYLLTKKNKKSMKKERYKVRNKGRNRQTLKMHIIIIVTEFLIQKKLKFEHP